MVGREHHHCLSSSQSLSSSANFNTPNLVVFKPSGVSGTAGAINSTATTSRQVQLALKLLW
jgi:hypothetical protein